MNKEIYFNELSVSDGVKWSHDDLSELGQLFLQLKKFGISTCRISGEVLTEMEVNLPSDYMGNTARILLHTMFKQPFESSAVEERQDDYYLHKWTYQGRDCYGLALAFIVDSLSYSKNSLEWDKATLEIYRDSVAVDVRNISNVSHVQEHSTWIESQLEPVLIETSLLPEQKSISLRDDHGKDKLEKFAKILCRSPYVEKIINSLEFRPWTNKFIGGIKENGVVELILVWEEQRCGVVVQTTGRNRRETEKIAEILQEKYGHR